MTIGYIVSDEQKVPKAYVKKRAFPPDAPPPAYPTLDLNQIIERTLKESADARAEPFVFDEPIKSVAVIGAGPAGLPTAKALQEHGISVRIFERMEDVGGVWLYSDEPDTKPSVPCDTYSTHKKLQSSSVPSEPSEKTNTIVEATADERLNKLKHAPPTACYPDLHNNTAAPIMMDFEDFPWPDGTPYYVPHGEVQQYYKNYAQHFGLYDIMELNTRVEYVERRQAKPADDLDDGDDKKWQLTLRKAEYIDNGSKIQYTTWTESFDAVAVASGAYNDPFIPDFPKLHEYNASYPERIIHSKQYRHYQYYAGKNVLIVGGNISAIDIAQRLDGIASNVYMSIRGNFKSVSNILNLARSVLPDSTIHKPNIGAFADPEGHVNGSITFEDNTVLYNIDHVIFCTGFVNDLGFLGPLRTYGTEPEDGTDEEEGCAQQTERPLVVTNGSRPINTYRDIFAILDPTLAFVGTPGHLTSTQFFYYQGQAVARVWAGLAWIPCYKKMRDHIKTNMYPFPPFDMNLLGCILHAQPFVTWLNDHAKYSNKNDVGELYKLKGVDPSLAKLWDGIKEQYKDRTTEILAKRKNISS
ncbi:hypothetical protein BDB00DRAFT_819620 [Zychaea mexicana]|uniref:uncharacterized protein n=1 Tax=Zychaea mexicana TaxID=64656 RepID=UPI0022FF12F5|nr:uncharacterized protein BDB00DRAFT_819620 [Zychaea mexicana]KAI9494299.1 hypothetical protein BDB00DRAFT_819620 [Zychaea mexicana]